MPAPRLVKQGIVRDRQKSPLLTSLRITIVRDLSNSVQMARSAAGNPVFHNFVKRAEITER